MLSQLRSRATGFARDLLDETAARLGGIGRAVEIEHAVWDDGEFHLTAIAPTIANEVREGDYVYAGFFLDHNPAQATQAGVRIYRVACQNGMLADEAEGQQIEFASAQPPPGWKYELSEVIAQSFEGGCLDEQTKRLRATVDEMLTSPFEFLIHLAAQGLIDDDEHSGIQREFERAGDYTLYGLVNAVTAVAHGHRSASDWQRALGIERLGGEIAGGDHQPPIGSPVFG